MSRRLSILQLPEEVLRELEAGRVSVEEAEQLIPLKAWPERVLRALGRRREWHGVVGAVKEELRQQREEEAMATALEKLRAEHPGVRVVDAPRYGWYRETAQPLARQHLNISVTKHAKLPCHAAEVERDGSVTWVCTRPELHANGARDAAALTAEEARRREERAHQRAEGKAPAAPPSTASSTRPTRTRTRPDPTGGGAPGGRRPVRPSGGRLTGRA